MPDLTPGARVYHWNRCESGTVVGPGAPDTTWIRFDGAHDDAEVSTALLAEIPAGMLPCGCVLNRADAHRKACPDHPGGKR